MKVAICSSDGAHVDLHFGKTSTFYIFEFGRGVRKLMDRRNVRKYCASGIDDYKNGNTHQFDKSRFESVFEAISDCKKMYTVSIGETPRQKLEEKGIEVEQCLCAIDWIPVAEGGVNSSKATYYLS